MKTAIILAAALSMLLLSGCDEETQTRASNPNLRKLKARWGANREAERFTVESFGIFHAGYSNNEREIVVVEDVETGIKYLGITGVGITELRKVTKGDARTPATVEE